MTQAKRYTRAYQVTVGTKSTVVHTENKSEAIERAITKLFGSRCFWFADSGLSGYGQVFEALQPTKNNSNPGNTSVTYRVGLDVEPIGKPSRNFLNQLKQDKIEYDQAMAEADAEQKLEWSAYCAGRSGQPFPLSDDLKKYYWQHYCEGQSDQEREERDEQERREQYDRECRERDERYQRDEYNQAYDEALLENAEYDAIAARRRAEVERLQSLPIETRCADERLQRIIRNTIAPSSFPTGLPLGEYKRRMLNGEYPEIVTEYLQSEKLFYRVNYID
ncbi:hypothetical protein M0R72_14145 [Candidatus Pacearchaeota archaeon]|jgi:hypothetical protein|nr:hypothetical protein [Candidatus Pacearchaeota archaeon]